MAAINTLTTGTSASPEVLYAEYCDRRDKPGLQEWLDTLSAFDIYSIMKSLYYDNNTGTDR